MPDIPSWANAAGKFINEVGIPNIVVVFVLLMVSGILPSLLSSQQQEIILVVKQIRTISASVAGLRYAECVNLADVNAGSDAEKFKRMEQRCGRSYDQLRRALEDLGAEASGKVEVKQ